jgi:hypothetical protein
LCLFATDLVEGEPLLDEDEIARYCSPGRYDLEAAAPKVGAFIRSPNESDLSVKRLQFFLGQDREGAVGCIRCEARDAGFRLKPNGRFVVLAVAAAKALTLEEGCEISVIYTPSPSYPSHSSVFGLPDDYADEVMVATALVDLITQADIYPAVVP